MPLVKTVAPMVIFSRAVSDAMSLICGKGWVDSPDGSDSQYVPPLIYTATRIHVELGVRSKFNAQQEHL